MSVVVKIVWLQLLWDLGLLNMSFVLRVFYALFKLLYPLLLCAPYRGKDLKLNIAALVLVLVPQLLHRHFKRLEATEPQLLFGKLGRLLPFAAHHLFGGGCPVSHAPLVCHKYLFRLGVFGVFDYFRLLLKHSLVIDLGLVYFLVQSCVLTLHLPLKFFIRLLWHLVFRYA